MKSVLTFLFVAVIALPGFAQDNTDPQPAAPVTLDIRDAHDVTLEEFLWLKRLFIVFADTDRDPAFREQMDLLKQRPRDLIERDVVVIIDTDPANPSSVREKLRPHGFGFVLIGKDGTVAMRKPTPWKTREIARAIDKMPLRQDELRAAKESG